MASNKEALKACLRILFAHPVYPAKPCAMASARTPIWIATEADRNATTFLLPDESERRQTKAIAAFYVCV